MLVAVLLVLVVVVGASSAAWTAKLGEEFELS